MNLIPNELRVYNPDLSIGWLQTIEHVSFFTNDTENDPHLKGVEWCFTTSDIQDDDESMGGFWEKIELLLFVDDHEDKIISIISFLNSREDGEFGFEELLNIINNTK